MKFCDRRKIPITRSSQHIPAGFQSSLAFDQAAFDDVEVRHFGISELADKQAGFAIRGRVCDFSELADKCLTNFTTVRRPIPKNRRPDPAFSQRSLRVHLA